MKRTGAWLTVYALEQIGARFTFGIPGVHTTELYDALNNSNRITQVLVTHEGGASFMADAGGRLSDSIGVLTGVPAAGPAPAASGIREGAFGRGAAAAPARRARPPPRPRYS